MKYIHSLVLIALWRCVCERGSFKFDSMNNFDSQVNENGEISSTRCLDRVKRQGLGKKKRNRVGGARPIDVNDEDVQLFLNEAIEKVNGDEDPDYS
jgi:hypothetical protein